MTIVPNAPADSDNSHAVGGPLSVGSSTGDTPVAPGPRRGYRVRPVHEIPVLAKGLAGQVAGAACQALAAHRPGGTSQQADGPGVITLVTTPVAGWYPMLAAALLEAAPQSHVPVRGIADVITAAAAVPPALDAMEEISRGFMRRIRVSFSERSPLLAEAELGGLWLDSVAEALLRSSQQQPRPTIRVAGIGVSQAQPDGCYFLMATASATLTWQPHRRLRKSPDVALAQWLLMTSKGDVIGGGIEKTSP
jgi:hypothetical protein